jgi:predicted secreted hydrolase
MTQARGLGLGAWALALLVGAASAVTAQSSWKSAAPGRAIVLPADHASHPDYKVEWWYYTGNLDEINGRPEGRPLHGRFGYQLTFFRIGMDPAPANPSRWAVRDLFMAHLALTDVNGKRYRFVDRMNRAGPGWAGAATDKYRVWNEDWQVTLENERVHRMVAATKEFGIDLSLDQTHRPVLNGDRGYHRKGSAEGNASFYYSLTRMPTRGRVTIGGEAFDVTGQSWMDHEFGTTFLEKGQVGWDWFALQLDDGRDLMIYQLRSADGSMHPMSSGTLVEADGTYREVKPGTFTLEPGRIWTSRASGGRYPVEWRVRVPGELIDVTVATTVDDQELRTSQSTQVTYWEGAIDVKGTVKGRTITGRGYLEMTGYAGASLRF